MWASLQPHQHRELDRRGFTIVELLIVIVVIGILAAITIVAFNGVQQKARVATLQSDLEGAAKTLEASKVISGTEQYPASLASTGLMASSGDSYQYSVNNAANPATYCVTATIGTTSYFISSTSPGPHSGGCPGDGVGGVAAITNLMINPRAENGTVGVSAANAAVSVDTSWSNSGLASFQLTPTSASNDSWMSVGGDFGGFRAGLQAGKTYTISATVRLTGALMGPLGGNGTRQITAWYTSAIGTSVETIGTQAPNAAGQSRVSVTFTVPATATGAWLRFYDGASVAGGSVWWDNIMITEGTSQYNFADGDSLNWIWNGTPNASSSTGSPL